MWRCATTANVAARGCAVLVLALVLAVGASGCSSSNDRADVDKVVADINKENAAKDPCWGVGYDTYSWETNINTGEVRPDDLIPKWPDPGSDNWRPATDAELQNMLDERYPGCRIEDMRP
jgi:hypothetical protein